jgi:hypothetical protein
MFKRIVNNIRHDITGNYTLIMNNAGRYKAFLYLSKASMMLCKAVILNKKTHFHNVEFYDIW